MSETEDIYALNDASANLLPFILSPLFDLFDLKGEDFHNLAATSLAAFHTEKEADAPFSRVTLLSSLYSRCLPPQVKEQKTSTTSLPPIPMPRSKHKR